MSAECLRLLFGDAKRLQAHLRPIIREARAKKSVYKDCAARFLGVSDGVLDTRVCPTMEEPGGFLFDPFGVAIVFRRVFRGFRPSALPPATDVLPLRGNCWTEPRQTGGNGDAEEKIRTALVLKAIHEMDEERQDAQV